MVVEAGAGSASQAGGVRDVAERVAVAAEMGNELLESVQGERPGATAIADLREDRVIAAETGHTSPVFRGGEYRFGAPLEEATTRKGWFPERIFPATAPELVRGDLGFPHFRGVV